MDDPGIPRFDAVVNDEEQYSIWLVGRELPDGWRRVGVQGTKEECLDYIETIWTDMRPLSLRRRMSELDSSDGQGTTSTGSES